MTRLTIVASITAKPDSIELIRTELQKLVPLSRHEAGCINYDLHQNNQNPAHFLVFENWESRELWQAHMNSTHFAQFATAIDGATQEVQVDEMTYLG